MNTATVSAMSADPDELASELAIATTGLAEAPAGVRVNGIQLAALSTEPGWPDAPLAWSLADDPHEWSMVVYADDEWQVFDIFRCVDLGQRMDGESASVDFFIIPLPKGWIATHADPDSERELQLCVGPHEATIWRTREAALAAARRHAQAMAARAATG